jgi:4-deoxy-L-threo-5-hexosulose-uronate ketol-isomerase
MQVDVIFISLSAGTLKTDHIKELVEKGKRIIMFDRVDEKLNVESVKLNDYQGAYNTVTHMMEQGYLKIAHFSGPENLAVYKERKRGYLDALRDHGINYHKVIKNTITKESGEEAMNQLLRHSIAPDAVFAASDYSALGALLAARKKNISVPNAIGIAGFANEPFTEYVYPGITTTDQKARLMGQKIAGIFLNDPEGKNHQKEIINPELIIRKSTLSPKQYDTERIRKEFLVSNIMQEEIIRLVYSFNDRLIVGGTVPVKKEVILESIDPLKSASFLDRREMGIINVGGQGKIVADGKTYSLNYKDALYLGAGTKDVRFISFDSSKPARFYINSAPAHKSFSSRLITLADAEVVELGTLETSNARKINKLLVNSVVETCQLQMGMTELKTGSVWNTMPPHVHSRRMEAYFYFEVPENQAICHFMGEPQETRHLWLKNEEAVISPPWSIHAAAGTSNYTFIWGMGGENLDYGDMDAIKIQDIR